MVDASQQPDGVKTRICPWWLMSLSALAEPLRRIFWPAARILQPLVAAGQMCLDMGCGMGFFTVPLAQFVGATGRVVAVDIQSKMLEGAARRAKRHGMTDRISFYRPEDSEWATPRKYDFILVFWMLHEVPDQRSLLETLHGTLKTSGCILLVEPRLHVRKPQWEESLALAKAVHLAPRVGPPIALSRSAILQPRNDD
ncbi:MAG: class I SAM-dependent methyltransferase [Planctomycetes bacterium]|nr:class I SAM-dependent methyltransferase [Planctomycetota bacterium]